MTARLVTAIQPQDTWWERAACRDRATELFFPDSRADHAQIAAAKAICEACPVIAECGQWAAENRQDAGIWGGRTEWERQAIKRRGGRGRAVA